MVDQFFRKAKITDAKELSKLRRGVFGKIKGEEYLPSFVKALSDANSPNDIKRKIKSYSIFCLVDKKEIIGMVGLNGIEIKGVFVKVSHVRRGIGTKLMDFIEEYAKKKGLKKVHLWSAEKAKEFYKKLGYKLIKKVSKPYKKIRNVNFVMEKEL
ncbi:MAG: GNAT family N-acetyltransferase [archaeon]